MITKPLFPLWQIDQQEYQAVCAYLSVSPKMHIYEKLFEYFANAPFRYDRPCGFPLFLAKSKLTRFRIARLDLVTKLFFPNHPVRHILNGIIALHECDGEGYSQMASPPRGWTVPFFLLGWAIMFSASFAITTVWLCWQFVFYLLGWPLQPKDDVAGKRILITGVNRGLGLDLLLDSLEQGAEVVGTVRNRDNLDSFMAQLPAEAPVKILVADLSQAGALVKVLNQNQITNDSVDIAILCAGVKYSGTSVLSMSRLRETFEVNYFSSIDLAQWLFSSGNKTTLVLVSSIGRWHGMHLSCGYNASKAALSIWGESLEMELRFLGNRDCKIMIAEPGIFESGMMAQKGVNKLLFASRRELAERIISGALKGKKVLRYPFWFALLTWMLCLGGRSLRYHLFARNKR